MKKLAFFKSYKPVTEDDARRIAKMYLFRNRYRIQPEDYEYTHDILLHAQAIYNLLDNTPSIKDRLRKFPKYPGTDVYQVPTDPKAYCELDWLLRGQADGSHKETDVGPITR